MKSWNGGSCCSRAVEEDVNDIAYFKQMLKVLTKKYNVDKNKIYVTGRDNGGSMAFRLACELSDKIAAVVTLHSHFGIKNVTEHHRCAASN